MPVLEQLVFFGRLKGISRRRARESARAWLERLGIGDCAERRLQELSKGMQQKVQFIAAVLHDPPLLVLDEPFAGLDPVNAGLFLDEIRALHARGATILLSTHHLEQAERLVGAICLIHHSRVVIAGELARLKSELGRGRVLLDWSGDPAALADPSLVLSHRERADGWEFTLRDGADPQALLRRAVDGGEVRRFQLLEPSLSEIYLERVGGLERDAPRARDPADVPRAGEGAP
jgi:ABC-2 type transport system ATP-binding protein